MTRLLLLRCWMSILSRTGSIRPPTKRKNSLQNLTWTKTSNKPTKSPVGTHPPSVKDVVQVTLKDTHTKKQSQVSNVYVPKTKTETKENITSRWLETSERSLSEKNENLHVLNKENRPAKEETNQKTFQTFWNGEKELLLTEKEYLKLRWMTTKAFASGEKDQRLLLPANISNILLSQNNLVSPEQQKTASVAVIGLPNAGKSTLLNKLLGSKVVAVSRKRNTTRTTHTVYMTEGEKQLVFYDTPGLIGKEDAAKVHHERALLTAAWNATWHADIGLVMFKNSKRSHETHVERIKERIEEDGKSIETNILTELDSFLTTSTQGRDGFSGKQIWILVLNKIDQLASRQYLTDISKEFHDIFPFAMTFMVSAKKERGIDHIRDFLFHLCRPGEWVSSQAIPYGGSVIEMVEDILREKLLHCVHFEVPYRTKFQLESCKIISSGVIAVEEQILVERKSQIGMIVGPNGSNIQWIQRMAERDLSQVWKMPVVLYIDVQVATAR
eukprot:jgi/Galph1/4273/GphlegSOOS_G2935.1